MITLIEKNPTECKNSVCIHGVYICKIEQIPCARTKECALNKVKRMTDAMEELIHSDFDYSVKECKYG